MKRKKCPPVARAVTRQAGKPDIGFEVPLKSQLRCEFKGLPIVL
jgi:hypothetical protein